MRLGPGWVALPPTTCNMLPGALSVSETGLCALRQAVILTLPPASAMLPTHGSAASYWFRQAFGPCGSEPIGSNQKAISD